MEPVQGTIIRARKGTCIRNVVCKRTDRSENLGGTFSTLFFYISWFVRLYPLRNCCYYRLFLSEIYSVQVFIEFLPNFYPALSHIFVTTFFFSSKQKSFVMSQIRGSCGHTKPSWDNHTACFSCSCCSFETRCSTCREWTSAIWTLVAKRRTSIGWKKSTDDMKKWDMGASVTLHTVSPAVEGSSDNRHTGSGASIRKSQSETLSQSEKALGEKYRDYWENFLSDTLRYKRTTPDRSSSLATPVSTDLRIDTSPVPSKSSVHLSPVKQASRHRSPVDQATRHQSPADQSTRQRSFTRSPVIWSPGIQAKGYQSNGSSEMEVDLVHRSTKHQSLVNQSNWYQ